MNFTDTQLEWLQMMKKVNTGIESMCDMEDEFEDILDNHLDPLDQTAVHVTNDYSILTRPQAELILEGARETRIGLCVEYGELH